MALVTMAYLALTLWWLWPPPRYLLHLRAWVVAASRVSNSGRAAMGRSSVVEPFR
jgi:hypothetical protein